MNKLVLFIHGLGGDADGTWQKFPELMRSDADITARYDVETFEYDAGLFWSKPSLTTVASSLKTEIENATLPIPISPSSRTVREGLSHGPILRQDSTATGLYGWAVSSLSPLRITGRDTPPSSGECLAPASK